jgi:hypothetical protein
MNADDLQPGMRLTNAAYSIKPANCRVTRVARTRWRKRVTWFWVIWEGERAEAAHTPEDAQYLEVIAGK